MHAICRLLSVAHSPQLQIIIIPTLTSYLVEWRDYIYSRSWKPKTLALIRDGRNRPAGHTPLPHVAVACKPTICYSTIFHHQPQDHSYSILPTALVSKLKLVLRNSIGSCLWTFCRHTHIRWWAVYLYIILMCITIVFAGWIHCSFKGGEHLQQQISLCCPVLYCRTQSEGQC